MTDPAKYTPTYNFTAFQAQSPTSPMPAPRLDEQFDNISQSVNQAIDALSDIRRSDGQLKNGIVTPESLSSALNIGFTMAGQWLVGESYNGGDGVVHNQKFYVALIANVATPANAPDLDASTWSYLFSVDDLVVAGALSIPVVSGVGDGTTKTFTLPVAPASVNNVFAKVGVNVLSLNAYTVSGPSITLATAPAIGVAYEFRILSTIAVTELEQAVYDARDLAVSKAAEAAASASAAAGSASAAAGSASAAASSATAANTSKNDAAASASAASGSASAAATSASNASSSATSAAGSASAAAGSASAASTSATNASNSATSAASSQTAAANSASAASTSATNALASENAAEDAADRAEAAAAGVEFPVSYEPQSLTLAQQGQARKNIKVPVGAFRNALINPLFNLNQRGVSGSVSLAAGEYGHDRMKAGVSGCNYTFSTNNGVTTLNITSGTLQQVVEASTFAGREGAYTLSWAGNAQGRIGSGPYGTSGNVSAVCDGSGDEIVEFNSGTLSLVQFEFGYVTDFSARHKGQELELCQRYFEVSQFLSRFDGNGGSSEFTAGGQTVFVVQKRNTPSITIVAQALVKASGLTTTDITNVRTGFLWGWTEGNTVTERSVALNFTADAEL
ncbi:MAG: hypothetical protein ACTHLK_22005 [Brucella intermedia]